MAIVFEQDNKGRNEKFKKPFIYYLNLILIIIGAIGTLYLLTYKVAELFPLLILLPLLIIYLLALLVPVCFTIGIVLISDGYRSFISKFSDILLNSFNSLEPTVELYKGFITPITIITIVILFIGLLISNSKKKIEDNSQHSFKILNICSIVFLTLSIIGLIIAFI